jgi:hypothetical protein
LALPYLRLIAALQALNLEIVNAIHPAAFCLAFG